MQPVNPVHWIVALVVVGGPVWLIWFVVRRMKETVRSLRWYFGIFGFLGLFGSIAVSRFEHSSTDVWAVLTTLYSFAISCAALYAAFALPDLLRTRLPTMVAVIEVSRVLTVITFVQEISTNRPGPRPDTTAWAAYLWIAFALWLQGYLKKNLKRLAFEALPSTSPAANSQVANCPECGTAVGAWRNECDCGHRFADRAPQAQ